MASRKSWDSPSRLIADENALAPAARERMLRSRAGRSTAANAESGQRLSYNDGGVAAPSNAWNA
jgi:hypothetical protein